MKLDDEQLGAFNSIGYKMTSKDQIVVETEYGKVGLTIVVLEGAPSYPVLDRGLQHTSRPLRFELDPLPNLSLPCALCSCLRAAAQSWCGWHDPTARYQPPCQYACSRRSEGGRHRCNYERRYVHSVRTSGGVPGSSFSRYPGAAGPKQAIIICAIPTLLRLRYDPLILPAGSCGHRSAVHRLHRCADDLP